MTTGPRHNAPNSGQSASPGAAPVVRYDTRDAEIARLKGELERAQRSAEVAEAQARASRRAFAELARTSRSFAHTIRDRAAERRTSRRRLGMQYEVVRTLASCQSLEEASPRLLKILGDWLGWKAIARWEVENGALRCADVWRVGNPPEDLPDGAEEPFAEARVGARLRRGEGIAGRTWEAGELSWIVSGDDGEEAGVLAFPVQTASLGTTGVFVCYDGKEKALDEDLRSTVILVGEQIGQAEERWRLEGERNRALAGQRRATAELSGILESISDAFFALDAERRFTYVNREAEQLWGKRREELLGRNVWEVFPRTVGSEPYEAVEKALTEGVAAEYEAFSTALDLWVLGRIYPRSDGGVSVYFRDVTERKQAEEALRESEERTRLATEAALMFTWEVDRAKGEVRYSPNAEEVMGFALPTAVDEVIALAQPEERAGAAELYRRVVRGEEDLDAEYRVVRPGDGESVWIRIQGVLVGGGGETARFLGVTQNVTERKRAEEALRQSEARAQLALDVAQLGMWGWDPTDDGVYADARCREICGLDPAADLTMDEVVSRVHPEDRPRIEAALAAALRPEGSGVYAEEFRFVRDGGSSIYVVARGQTRFEGKGRGRRPKRLLGTVLDVTEQREVDEALRESEERFRSIANLVPDLLWSSDPDGNSYWYNQRWLQYTGQNLGQAQGYGWLDAIHPEDRERSRSNFQSAVDAGEPLSQEHRIRGEDGRYRWFLVRTEPARDAKGRVTRWFGAATDIHDQRTAMEALQESEERYRTLFESMDEGFCVVEMIFDESGEPVDYRFERMNPAFERHTGLVGAQGKTAREMVPNLEAHWFETYGRVALTGEPAHFVDGSEAMGRWFDVYAFRPQGAMSRRVAILFNDVSERRQAEEALRESEQNYRTLVSNFPGAVYRCEWREEPTMVFVSDRIAEITGYPAEDFVENRVRSYGSLIHPEDRPLLDEQVLSALMRGEPYALEYRILHADGGVRWINERGSGFFSEEGVLLYLDGAIFDVTVREEARRALKESEERLRAVVDNAPIILVAFDRDGVYRLAEGRGHDALGVAPGGAVGRSAFEIFRDNRPVLEDTRRALAGEAFVAVRKINGALWETTYTPLRDEAGEPAGAIAVGTDVTDRKRAEEERDRLRAQEWVARAEAGERERISRELHDRVAHQMAVVHQSLELYGVLKTAAPERAETRLSLARDLAKASLDATRNLSAELRRSEAEDGLEAALRDLLDAIEAPGFATELAVRGDEGLIPPHIRGQVFMILREAVRNAARHSGGEGVSVAVEVTPEELVGSVEDGGMGMDGDGSGEGTVGLKSMRERTQLLGGRFHMETGPEGTKIVVRVPLNGRRKDG